MPSDPGVPNGVPCWVELATGEADSAAAFYCALFGWEARPLSREFARYLVLYNRGTPIGALSEYQAVDSTTWVVYLTTDDAGRTLEEAQSAGARLVSPAFVVSNYGTMALIEDPAGAQLGIWQPDTFPGFSQNGHSGFPVFFELEADDWVGEANFYGDLFGLEARAVGRGATGSAQLLAGERRVAVLRSGGEPGSPGVAHWMPHFSVHDLRQATHELLGLGGSVLGPSSGSRSGRRIEVADPLGGRFHLLAKAA